MPPPLPPSPSPDDQLRRLSQGYNQQQQQQPPPGYNHQLPHGYDHPMGPPPPNWQNYYQQPAPQTQYWVPRNATRRRDARSQSPGRGRSLNPGAPEPPRRQRSPRGRSPPPSDEESDEEPDDEDADHVEDRVFANSASRSFFRKLIKHLKSTQTDKWSIRDKNTPAAQLAKQARLIPRVHTPFIDGTSIITVGMLWHGGVPPRWDVPEASLSPKQATL
ncbi:hypothetical protein K466DRAFT_599030 [Polyporus arcularius HHB13444]|uniref:Uncharacterized protein n=1 Tax=Polyporus arcularius HHB13444 TaxID=1314778 RepID=A0A5C3PG60_9APHY|nr:hypothetical protein K466DRAFT_599030 [Polyporus arcularius HHB13444]